MMQRIFKPTWKAVLDNPQFRWLNIMARLAPGTSIARAQAPTDAAHRIGVEIELAKQHASGAEADPAKYRLELRPAPQGINEFRRDQQTPLLALMAMAGLTLLIACANVASLTVARATARRREMSIRLAIGATRWNLVRQLLVEGVMLAAAGGALGLLVADWSTKALLHALPQDFAGDWLKAGLNLRLLAFACGLSLVSGVLFALAPALQSTRHNLAGSLRAGAAASVGSAVWFRKCVVAAQVALSLVLVVGAGLFSGTLYNLAKVNLGFRTERLMTFKVDATRNRPLVADSVAFYRALQERLAAIPGVTGVAASGSGPFSNSNNGGNITVEGYQPKNNEYVGSSMNAVNPGFFAALGIRLRAGREFTDRDGAGAPKTVVVNEAFAKLYCGGPQSGGAASDVWRQAITRCSTAKSSAWPPMFAREVREPAKPALYYPYAQWKQPERLMYYVRAAGVETALGPAIRAAVRDEDPNVPVAVLQPITVRIDDNDVQRAAAGDAFHGLRRAGHAAGGDRSLWRGGVRGDAADGGDRRAHGAGRAAGRRDAHGAGGSGQVGAGGNCGGRGGGAGAEPAGANAIVRRAGGGPAHTDRRGGIPGGGGDGRGVHAGAESVAD